MTYYSTLPGPHCGLLYDPTRSLLQPSIWVNEVLIPAFYIILLGPHLWLNMRLYQVLIMASYVILSSPNYGFLYCFIRSSFVTLYIAQLGLHLSNLCTSPANLLAS